MQLTITLDPRDGVEVLSAIRLLQSLEMTGADPYAGLAHGFDKITRVEPEPGTNGVPAVAVVEPAPVQVFTPDPATVFAGNEPAGAPIAAAPVGTPPAPTPEPVASAPSGVDVDAKGLPWDMRIHAGTKVKNADGSWRAKRGLNDGALVARVEAELRAAMSAPAGNVPAAPAPSVPVVATPAPPVPSAGGGAPPPAEPAAPPVPPAPPAASTGKTFPEIMRKISGLLSGAAPQLTHPEMQSALLSVGLASLPLLVSRPDLIAQVDEAIDAILAGKASSAAPVPPLPPGTAVH